MTNDWHELTDLTADRRFCVTEVRMDSGISIQGEFELPPLARLDLQAALRAVAAAQKPLSIYIRQGM